MKDTASQKPYKTVTGHPRTPQTQSGHHLHYLAVACHAPARHRREVAPRLDPDRPSHFFVVHIMVRSAVIVLAAGASLTDALQVQPIVRTTHARAATPTMQFGFQNYDREVEAEKRGSNPINYLNPFATGSTVCAKTLSHLAPSTKI